MHDVKIVTTLEKFPSCICTCGFENAYFGENQLFCSGKA